jgi:hypothetical protein
MSTDTQAPDFAAIAKRLAADAYPRKMWPEGTLDEVRRQRKGYATCMEGKLQQDWETIRLLKNAMHDGECGYYAEPFEEPCTCGLDANLSTLEAQFK